MEKQIQQNKMLQFALAGKSIFTLRNELTGGRFTFKVTDFQRTEAGKAENNPEKRLWFVKVLTGPDNYANYTFIGTIFDDDMGHPDGEKRLIYRHSRKTTIREDATSVRVFSWFLKHIQLGDIPDHVQMFHEGRCGRCGKRLTVPESILSGYGPECIGKIMGSEI